jgi:hypothetical protein
MRRPNGANAPEVKIRARATWLLSIYLPSQLACKGQRVFRQGHYKRRHMQAFSILCLIFVTHAASCPLDVGQSYSYEQHFVLVWPLSFHLTLPTRQPFFWRGLCNRGIIS